MVVKIIESEDLRFYERDIGENTPGMVEVIYEFFGDNKLIEIECESLIKEVPNFKKK